MPVSDEWLKQQRVHGLPRSTHAEIVDELLMLRATLAEIKRIALPMCRAGWQSGIVVCELVDAALARPSSIQSRTVALMEGCQMPYDQALELAISEAAPFDVKRNSTMQAIGEVLQAEAKADPTMGQRGLANWMGVAGRIYDALNAAATDQGKTP